jgi:hypothetical protein
MTLQLDWAPVEFGLAWAGALVLVGLHLQNLGREQKAEAQAASDAPTVLDRRQAGKS